MFTIVDARYEEIVKYCIDQFADGHNTNQNNTLQI